MIPPFKVGDKVECIEEWSSHSGIIVPIKGDIYTIRDMHLNELKTHYVLLFDEIRNTPDPITKNEINFSAGMSPGYHYWNFKKVVKARRYF